MASPCPLRLGGFHGLHVFRVFYPSIPGRSLGLHARASRVLCFSARRRMAVTTLDENGSTLPAAEAEQNAADEAARAAAVVVDKVAAVVEDLTRASADVTRHEVGITRDTVQVGLNTG